MSYLLVIKLGVTNIYVVQILTIVREDTSSKESA